jgi:hypothetical protein
VSRRLADLLVNLTLFVVMAGAWVALFVTFVILGATVLHNG